MARRFPDQVSSLTLGTRGRCRPPQRDALGRDEDRQVRRVRPLAVRGEPAIPGSTRVFSCFHFGNYCLGWQVLQHQPLQLGAIIAVGYRVNSYQPTRLLGSVERTAIVAHPMSTSAFFMEFSWFLRSRRTAVRPGRNREERSFEISDQVRAFRGRRPALSNYRCVPDREAALFQGVPAARPTLHHTRDEAV